MRREPLPYERRFRDWIDRQGMGWERLEIRDDRLPDPTTAYRFTPAGRVARRVLAIHGAGNDALFGWIDLFRLLLASDTEILTYDLPGHGRFNSGPFTVEAVRASVGVGLDRLQGAGGRVPAHAIGVSLGGSILLSALPTIQHRLASAAAIVPPLRIVLTARSFVNELRPRNVGIVVRERDTYGLTGLVPSFGPFRRGLYPLRLPLPPPPGPFGYVASLNDALEQLGIEVAATRVEIPVLLVYGERDRIVPAEQGVRVARLIPGARLEKVPGATHLSTPLEPATAEFILDWIRSHE